MGRPKKIYYQTTQGLKRKLQEASSFSSRKIEEIICHERKHFQEARKRGYEARYVFSSSGEEFEVSVVFFGEKIPDEDYLAVLLAPENPSKKDIETAKEYGWRAA